MKQRGNEPHLIVGELVGYLRVLPLSHSYQEQIHRAVSMRVEVGVS